MPLCLAVFKIALLHYFKQHLGKLYVVALHGNYKEHKEGRRCMHSCLRDQAEKGEKKKKGSIASVQDITANALLHNMASMHV